MSSVIQETIPAKPRHPWLRPIKIAFVPGPMSALSEEVIAGLLDHARLQGHQIQPTPNDDSDIILTTATYGTPLNWRQALMLSGRRRFRLQRTPAVYTMLHVERDEFRRILDHFQVALAKEPPDPADFDFPGLASTAYLTLVEQGRRGGPILSLERLLQAQAKCIRILLLVGDERPQAVYHFDLVGAYPRSEANNDLLAFYDDILLRVVTTVCTDEVTRHQEVGDAIRHDVWQSLDTPKSMTAAARQLGERSFFTKMVRIADLVHVPSVGDAVAEQYSEGCFSTWDPTLGALIATITGSARPVKKSDITEDDLAVIVGVRPDGKGALVRRVAGKQNSPPSSEALEMIDMDTMLPTIQLEHGGEENEAMSTIEVPVTRSKLHGHRGIRAFHPDYVEYVPMEPQYHHYIVSCATGAQAEGIKGAFARSAALTNPDDPRQVAFTILPGHGSLIVEKWLPGKAPFQLIWEHMDAGYLQVDNRIPQGLLSYAPGPDGLMVLEDLPETP
jgi:hypothetical protein